MTRTTTTISTRVIQAQEYNDKRELLGSKDETNNQKERLCCIGGRRKDSSHRKGRKYSLIAKEALSWHHHKSIIHRTRRIVSSD